ncbi:MAG: hypothetical protein J6C25_06295 [Treponema sp.]|nr:hypothetical protein [Treponema sp.]MBO5483165.1 hypothetical protein [Spirochaetaceae bacterium]MBP3562371.1 hypothetical protein [Treponema sp.]
MDSKTAEHIKGLCTIYLTKYLINKFHITHEEAYKKLLNTETYKLILDDNSNMFLESDLYLQDALDIEYTQGKEAFYNYITQE